MTEKQQDGGRTGESIKSMTHTNATKHVKTCSRLLGSCDVHEHAYTAQTSMHTFPFILSILQAINSRNRAAANSFIQSRAERQNACSL